MHLWLSHYDSFIRFAQYDYVRRLIVVPLLTFHRLAELIGDPEGQLIFLFNTGRCGSTLLTWVNHRSSDYKFLANKNSHNTPCLKKFLPLN